MADRAGLEIQCGVTPTEGSNPSLSALSGKALLQRLAAVFVCGVMILNLSAMVIDPADGVAADNRWIADCDSPSSTWV